MWEAPPAGAAAAPGAGKMRKVRALLLHRQTPLLIHRHILSSCHGSEAVAGPGCQDGCVAAAIAGGVMSLLLTLACSDFKLIVPPAMLAIAC